MSCKECDKKNVFEKAQAIATGTLNYVFNDPRIEEIALERIKICNNCPFSRILIKVGDIMVRQCTKCICLTELKVRVETEFCPINKW